MNKNRLALLAESTEESEVDERDLGRGLFTRIGQLKHYAEKKGQQSWDFARGTRIDSLNDPLMPAPQQQEEIGAETVRDGVVAAISTLLIPSEVSWLTKDSQNMSRALRLLWLSRYCAEAPELKDALRTVGLYELLGALKDTGIDVTKTVVILLVPALKPLGLGASALKWVAGKLLTGLKKSELRSAAHQIYQHARSGIGRPDDEDGFQESDDETLGEILEAIERQRGLGEGDLLLERPEEEEAALGIDHVALRAASILGVGHELILSDEDNGWKALLNRLGVPGDRVRQRSARVSRGRSSRSNAATEAAGTRAIDGLRTTIDDALTSQGELNLAALASDTGALGAALASLPLAELPTLEAASWVAELTEEDRIAVSGVFDALGVETELTIVCDHLSSAPGGLRCQLLAALAPDHSWELDAIPDTDNLLVCLQVTPTGDANRPMEILASLSGTTSIGEEELDLDLRLGSGLWSLQGDPHADSAGPALADLASAFGLAIEPPPFLSEIRVRSFAITYDPEHGLSGASLTTAADPFPLGSLEIVKSSAEMLLWRVDDSWQHAIEVACRARLGPAEFWLLGREENNAWSFRGSVANLALGELLQSWNDSSLPPGLTDLTIDLMDAQAGTDGSFSLAGDVSWTDGSPSLGGLGLYQLHAGVSRGADGEIGADVSATLRSVDDATEGLSVDELTVAFSRQGNDDWKAGAHAQLTVLGNQIGDIEGSLRRNDDVTTLELSRKGLGLRVIDSDAFKLDLLDCAITIDLESKKGTSDGGSKTGYNFNGGAAVTIRDQKYTGSLELDWQDGAARLVLHVDGSIGLTLPIPAELLDPQPRILVTDTRLEVGRLKDSGWELIWQGGLTFEDWPRRVQQALGGSVDASITLSSKVAKLEIENWGLGFDMPLEIQRGDETTDLGTASLELLSLGIDLMSLETSIELGPTLPAELNKLFGQDQDGHPREIMRTGEPIPLQLSAAPGGLKIVPRQSPLAALTFPPDNNWNVDLGAAGSLSFAMPYLQFSPSKRSFGFAASATQHLALPIAYLKKALRPLLPAAILDALPDQLPLADISVMDGDELQVQRLLDQWSGFDIPDPVRRGLDELSQRAGNLPERFKEYLRASIPKTLSVQLDVQPSGSASFSIIAGPPGDESGGATSEKEWLYLLIPIPQAFVFGIRLHSVSFGPLLGGSLFQLELDAEFDRFDLPTLAASAASGSETLKDSRSVFVVEDLNTLFILASGVPVPVPIFFRRLAFDYRGPLGGGVRGGFGFMPELDLFALFQQLGALWSFVEDDQRRLLPAELGAAKLEIRLEGGLIELPGFLGSTRLETPEIVLDSDKALEPITRLLNGIKFFSPTDLLLSLPLDQRQGSFSVSFGPVALGAGALLMDVETELQATWDTAQLANTPPDIREFLNLPPGERSDLLGLLPPSSSLSGDERASLALVLAGYWRASPKATTGGARVFLILANGGEHGSAAAVRMHAGFGSPKLGGTLELDIGGVLGWRLSEGSPPAAHLDADAHLSWGETTLMQGKVHLADDYLEATASFDVPGFPLSDATAGIYPDKIHVGATWGGYEVSIDALEAGDELSGHLPPKPITAKWLSLGGPDPGKGPRISITGPPTSPAVKLETKLTLFGQDFSGASELGKESFSILDGDWPVRNPGIGGLTVGAGSTVGVIGNLARKTPRLYLELRVRLKSCVAKWGNYETRKLACSLTVTWTDSRLALVGSFAGEGRLKKTIRRKTVWTPWKGFKGSLDDLDLGGSTDLQSVAKKTASLTVSKLKSGKWSWS